MSYFTDEHRVRNYEIVCAFTAGMGFTGMAVILLLLLNGGLSCH